MMPSEVSARRLRGRRRGMASKGSTSKSDLNSEVRDLVAAAFVGDEGGLPVPVPVLAKG